MGCIDFCFDCCCCWTVVALQAVQRQWQIQVDHAFRLRQEKHQIQRNADKLVEVCQLHFVLPVTVHLPAVLACISISCSVSHFGC